MRKIIAALLTSFVITGVCWAEDLVINDDVPNRYVVVKGDTLWDIADMYLQDPWKWQDIWYLNPQVENPHLIYPGDIIGLITVNGETRLTRLTQGENSNTLKINTNQADDNGVIKLRPIARITPIFGAIPAIAREHIDGFLSGNRILNTEELKSAPYIISGSEGRVIMGASDTVFGRGEFDSTLSVYQIYSMGKEYIDPVTEEGIGFEAIELGQARLKDLESDIATFVIEQSNQEISLSDRILPSDETSLDTFFYPSEPPKDLTGVIIDVASGVKFIGQFDIILLNVGERNDVEAGNIFRIARSGDRIRDPINNQRIQLPDEDAGLAMVFRVFDKMSYALVLDSQIPMRIGDTISNPGF
jgi:hypothetical protein